MKDHHRLLTRQLRAATTSDGTLDCEALFDLVSAAYAESDQEQRRTDRSISLMVAELDAVNAGLEAEVGKRTRELDDVRLRLEQTLASVDQGIVMVDGNGRVVVRNAAFLRLTGLTASDFRGRRTFNQLVKLMQERGEFALMGENFAAVAAIGGSMSASGGYVRVRPDGTVLQIRCKALPGGGEVRTLSDVTALARQREHAEAMRETLQVALDNISHGVIKVDAKQRVEFFNPRVEELLSLPKGFLKAGMAFKDILDWQLSNGEFKANDPAFTAYARSGDMFEVPATYVRERPNGVILETRTVPLENGAAVRTYADITETRRREAQLTRIAHYDPLTGLANRSLLAERLERETAANHVAGHLALLCIDLDRFKDVNDTMGHEAGDQLLKLAAQRLTGIVAQDALAARFGGDEFVVMLPDAGTREDVAGLAAAIVRELSEPYRINGKQCWVGASIGIAMSDPHDRPRDLLKKADLALYRAKGGGRGTYKFFQASMQEVLVQRREVEDQLRHAIQQRELCLVYQPIVDLETGNAVAFEALIRWNHPTRGMLAPFHFIDIAEDSGLIVPIGEFVLNEACRAFAGIDPSIAVSVNLSPVQFGNHGLALSVAHALGKTGLRPDRLILEITERVLLTQDERTLAMLEQLRGLGVKIALDDFGIGNSSFAYLQKFTFDKIKLDRSFLTGSDDGGMSAAIRRSLIGLSRDVGIEMVIEGIETGEQHRQVRAEGARLGQGYLFGRPANLDAALKLSVRAVA